MYMRTLIFSRLTTNKKVLIYYRNKISYNVTDNRRKRTVKVVMDNFEVLTTDLGLSGIGIHRGAATLALRRHIPVQVL